MGDSKDKMADDAVIVVDKTVPSEYNLFEKQAFNFSELSSDTLIVQTMAQIGEGPFDIVVPPAPSLWWDLARSQIRITGQFVDDKGDDIAADGAVGPVNLLVHSLFSNIEMELNSQLMTDPNQLYPYRAMFETLCTYSPDVLRTRAACEMWSKDTGGKMKELAGGANKGLNERMERVNKSKIITLMGRPHVDLFNQEKCIPPGMGFKLRFIRAKPEFYCINKARANANDAIPKYKFKITSAELHLCARQSLPDLLAGAERALQQHNAEINFTKIKMKTYNIPSGATMQNIPNLYLDRLPDLLAFAFVNDAAFGGTYETNPFNFEHMNISKMVLRVNNASHPVHPLSPCFVAGKEDYTREYMHFIHSLELDIGNKAIDLTPQEWANGHTIWVFRLAYGPIAPYTPRPPAPQGTASLEIAFDQAPANNMQMICYAQYPCKIEIDANRNVIQ